MLPQDPHEDRWGDIIGMFGFGIVQVGLTIAVGCMWMKALIHGESRPWFYFSCMIASAVWTVLRLYAGVVMLRRKLKK